MRRRGAQAWEWLTLCGPLVTKGPHEVDRRLFVGDEERLDSRERREVVGLCVVWWRVEGAADG